MKERFFIEGLGGEKTLAGTIAVNGAKNAVLPAMAAALLFTDALAIENVPDIEDVKRMIEILEGFGASVTKAPGKLTITAETLSSMEFERTASKRMRASVILTGSMLARYGTATFPFPGGCVLGQRSIDLFLDAYQKMGAEIREEASEGDSLFHLSVPGGKLRGADIFFPIVSVTATEALMLAAVLAEGKTQLSNAAMEPEVTSVAEFLVSCGARIEGAGTPTITIHGGEPLTCGGRPYRTLPDRIEAGSFLILGALAARDLTITNCVPEHVEALTTLLTNAGVPIVRGKDFLKIEGNTGPSSAWRAVNVKTHEYPGFATDLQAPMTVFLTQVSGESTVFETIFEARLNYIDHLVKMGANITMWNSNKISVKGPTPLKGRELEGPDIRAGLAYVIAAVIAHGSSTIENIYYIDRGYERLHERLAALGLRIHREGPPVAQVLIPGVTA